MPPRVDITSRVLHARSRVRASVRPLVQVTLAAPIAWLIAHEALGHTAPIFAPIAAALAVGVTVAQPWQHAVELMLGVVFGVASAEALVHVVGQGWWQVGVMLCLATLGAIALGGSPVLVTQAGTAAILVATLPSQVGVGGMYRVLDTIVGAAVALVFTLLVMPIRPLRLVHRAAAPVIDELAGTFDDVGRALRDGDAARAEQALERARETGRHWAELDEMVGVGRQAARIAPVRWNEHDELVDIAQSVVQLDYAIRDGRVLARVAWRLTETGYPFGARLELTMTELAAAVRALDGHLAGEYDETLAARASALRATRLAASAPPGDDELTFTHLIGQIRSTTVDLLRATGLPRADAIHQMLAAVEEGSADE